MSPELDHNKGSVMKEVAGLFNGPTGLRKAIEEIDSMIENLDKRRFVVSPATESYIEVRSAAASLLRTFALLGRCSFVASRLKDTRLTKDLEEITNELRSSREKYGARLESALLQGAEEKVAEYYRWLSTFEDLVKEDRAGFEIEFESHLLQARDYIEYSFAGLAMAEIGNGSKASLERARESDSRLDSLISSFTPKLLARYPGYVVPLPSNFPESFWWRRAVFTVSERSRSKQASDAN